MTQQHVITPELLKESDSENIPRLFKIGDEYFRHGPKTLATSARLTRQKEEVLLQSNNPFTCNYIPGVLLQIHF